MKQALKVITINGASRAATTLSSRQVPIPLLNRLRFAVRQKLKQARASEIKTDGTFVTEIDFFCDRFLREQISDCFPGDGILSGETGSTDGSLPRRWIIDPIDGTYNLVRELPYFATLMALEVQGEIVLGIVDAPLTDERYWALKGSGAFKNEKKIQMSTVEALAKSHLMVGELSGFASRNLWEPLRELTVETARQRSFRDYMGFGFVFEGKAEVVIEPTAAPWDLAPMKILSENQVECSMTSMEALPFMQGAA